MSRRTHGWARSLRARGDHLSIGRQVFGLYAVILALVIGAGVLLAVSVADRLVERGAEERVRSVAEAVASMPGTADALVGADEVDPTDRLQPVAERLRRRADVSFVVVMSTDGIRYTHPNPDRIGGHFVGTFAPALRGEVVEETFEGTLGLSVRAVVPVYAGDGGEPVGLVAVGVTVDQVSDDLTPVLAQVLGVALLVLLVAGAGVWWIAKRLSRQTFGMGPAEVARLYAHHDAVLHAVREGLVVVDRDRRVVLMNDAARELLGLGGVDGVDGSDVQGRPVASLGVTGGVADLLASGDSVTDVVMLAGERLVVVSQVPVGGRGSLGTVLTLRDRTQVMALADELSSTRSLADALRAQVHESANRLHTVVMLVELGHVDSAVRLATGEVRATRALTNRLVGQFEEPTLVALLLGKVAEAAQRSVELVVTDDSRLASEFSEPVDLVTIVGNLVDNAVDAALAGSLPRRVEVAIEEDCDTDELVVRVRDSGAGFTPEGLVKVFEPGWTTKAADPERRQGRGIGMALVHQVVTRRGGRITVANAPTGGASVEVRLPLAAAAEAAAEAASAGGGHDDVGADGGELEGGADDLEAVVEVEALGRDPGVAPDEAAAVGVDVAEDRVEDR